jgi:hypothetical protein
MKGRGRATVFGAALSPAIVAAVSLAGSGAAFASCTGPGAPTDTQTRCLTAVQIPGNPLRSFDISWVNPDRAEYYPMRGSTSSIPSTTHSSEPSAVSSASS